MNAPGPSWWPVPNGLHSSCSSLCQGHNKVRLKAGSHKSPFSLLLVPSECWRHLQILPENLEKVPSGFASSQIGLLFSKGFWKGFSLFWCASSYHFQAFSIHCQCWHMGKHHCLSIQLWGGKNIIPLYFRESRCTRIKESWKFLNTQVQPGL